MTFRLLIFSDKDITDSQVCFSSHILEWPGLPFSLPATIWTDISEKRRQCCAGKGNIPWRLFFFACEPQAEVCWWRKLVKIQAYSALQDLTPQEGGLMSNTARSGLSCIIIANCRHFEACFSTHASSTKSTYSQCLGMDSPAPRFFVHSQDSTAVTLIFPCPDGNAAMTCCHCPPWLPFSPASKFCLHSLSPIGTSRGLASL